MCGWREMCCVIFCLGGIPTSIVGAILLLTGFDQQKAWDLYLQNKPFEVTCQILDYEINDEFCYYQCDDGCDDVNVDTDGNMNEEIPPCDGYCRGYSFTIQAMANMTSTGCMDINEEYMDYKLVETETDCLPMNETNIYDIYGDINDTMICYIPNDCMNDTFFEYDYAKPNDCNDCDGELFEFIGYLLLIWPGLIVCSIVYVLMYRIKKTMKCKICRRKTKTKKRCCLCCYYKPIGPSY